MGIGTVVYTPRFGNVKIKEVYDSQRAAAEAGYTEPTHYRDRDYNVLGKPIDQYHMIFAAAKRVGA